MKLRLESLGCRLNEAEQQSWSTQLQQLGHQLVAEGDEAELVILNSCAVTAEASRKSHQTLRRLRREHPSAYLVVTGCDATLATTEMSALGVDRVVNNRDKDRLVEQIRAELIDRAPSSSEQPLSSRSHAEQRERRADRGRTRAFVKVQDGCRYRCTFCVTTLARGEERSRGVGEIIDEIHTLVADGIQEVVLTGVQVAGYGSDLNLNLHALLAQILTQTSVARVRLASVEPWGLGDQLFELFQDPRLMPHMHLPLQSGSDAILRRMGRRCRADEFTRLVGQARAAASGFNITTDLIVGFPGEGDKEWQETLELVERIGFGHIHIFPFSARAGTPAAELTNTVPEPTRRERINLLQQRAAISKRRQLSQQLGQRVPVLWEGEGQRVGSSYRYFGYTPNFSRVQIDLTDPLGQRQRLQMTQLIELGAEGDRLIGQLEAGTGTEA